MSLLDNPITRTSLGFVIGGIFLAFMFYLLPTSDMPSGLSSALEWLFDTLWAFDFMIPVLTLLTCVSTILLIDILFGLVKFSLFVKKHITKPQ